MDIHGVLQFIIGVLLVLQSFLFGRTNGIRLAQRVIREELSIAFVDYMTANSLKDKQQPTYMGRSEYFGRKMK